MQYKTARELIENVYYKGEEPENVVHVSAFILAFYERTKNDGDFNVLWGRELEKSAFIEEGSKVAEVYDKWSHEIADYESRIWTGLMLTRYDKDYPALRKDITKLSGYNMFSWRKFLEEMREATKLDKGGA